ncbi:MAG: hypothetical protein A2Z29_00435 [Chloroflexi bacterium RBG_16_56_11]|nr:MAG: hypothetical protein A2Z29_00435 [Chloroflexi bacterium RBG_16_56_11]
MRFFRPWLQVLIVGTVLFIAAQEALTYTENPNYFPTVILLGSFVVPVSFVTYFYEHVKHREISMPLLTACALVGGVIGLIAAGFIEFNTLQGLSIGGLFFVGLVEESVKLIFPVLLFQSSRYRHEADGLLFGIAAGMGFAALETMGYGLVAFIRSQGNISVLWQVFLIRGFLSPAGHAAWTGFVCAVLWHERERKRSVLFNPNVLGAFIVVIVLHALWDVLNSTDWKTSYQQVWIIAGNVAIAGASLALVIFRYRAAKKMLAKENIQ